MKSCFNWRSIAYLFIILVTLSLFIMSFVGDIRYFICEWVNPKYTLGNFDHSDIEHGSTYLCFCPSVLVLFLRSCYLLLRYCPDWRNKRSKCGQYREEQLNTPSKLTVSSGIPEKCRVICTRIWEITMTGCDHKQWSVSDWDAVM